MAGRRRGPALDEEVGISVESGERQRRDRGHPLDSGQRAQPLLDRVVELSGLLDLGVAIGRGRQEERHQALRAEAEVETSELAEAAHQEPGGDQQDQRQRHLSDDQAPLQARGAAPGRARAVSFVQAGGEVVTGRAQRGSQTEEQPGAQRCGEGEAEHAQVDRHLVDAGRAGRREPHEEAGERVGERHAEDAAQTREQHALGEQLGDDAPAVGAERGAQCDLAAAARAPCEQQVGQVDAHHQQHGDHGAEQQPQPGPGVAHDVVLEREQHQPGIGVALGVGLGEPGS